MTLQVVAIVLEREARRGAAPVSGDGIASKEGGGAVKPRVVDGYLMRRPPARDSSSAVLRWTWSEEGGASLPVPPPAPPPPLLTVAPDNVLTSVAEEAPATAPFAGFTVLEGPPAYLALSPAAGTDAPPRLPGGDGGEAGGVLPDVIGFVKLLGGLRRADAKLPAPGKPADLLEAASCFRWPSADSAATPSYYDELVLARAPGRLDLMGGIADYSGSLVLQMPIREACLVAMQRQPSPSPGELAKLRIVSLGADDNHRAPAFEMPLKALLKAGSADGPITYEAARALFKANPSTLWAAYVAGCLLVLAREKGVDFGADGLTILLRSDVPEGKGVSSSASIEVATMCALLQCYAPEVAAVCGPALVPGTGTIPIPGRELGLLAQMVENRVVGAPCGVMDQMASLLGRQGQLLALLCQPAEPLAYVDIPSSLSVWGIDSGIRHAVSGADYGSVRVGAFMGYCWLQQRAFARLIEAKRDEAEDGFQDSLAVSSTTTPLSVPHPASSSDDLPNKDLKTKLGGGYLANVKPSELAALASLPEAISGAAFLAQFPDGHGDTVTTIAPETTYAMRVPTQHAIAHHDALPHRYAMRVPTQHPSFEHFRVQTFAELLHGEPVASGPFGRQVEMLGELMYQSHASYTACGLGSDGTERLVELVRRAGVKRGLYGAKITGGGSGGTVAVLGHVGAGEAIEAVVDQYALEFGRLDCL